VGCSAELRAAIPWWGKAEVALEGSRGIPLLQFRRGRKRPGGPGGLNRPAGLLGRLGRKLKKILSEPKLDF
jgi:hypothetical protein